ncbi:S41 family peptidase [Ureibacillus sinduriensis]|uniref:Peptidase S41 n=1 Tax=Ureibacillus sinduriensis BLB-1 = JCM 15800 TaxID=1384057 RepID=A0A0A3INV7_9BACL|nr:S41 family peptidase [Ureibacillus sinduriensis]KGR76522.1 peptidase S41 [Ureibacillus sinduriensis BLB-1 = JCM 15800]
MKRYAPMLLAILLTVALPFHASAATLDDVKEIVKSEYVGEINGDLNSATSIDEVIDMLDPYSDYFSKEEYEAFTNSIEMETVGIGIVIEKHEKGILIVDVIENGSAYSSGFEAGDIITKINGQSTFDMSVEQAQSLIVGEENSIVDIEILKTNGKTVKEIIKRRPFSLPNVNAELLYGNVGYISINSFSENAAEEVAKVYSNLLKQGASSFIVDLQNNGGGYVVTAEKLIGMFPGATYAYKIKLATESGLVRASQQGVEFPTKTRLLVNRYSASASEMTAAALLDQHSAILYGESTYGKGTMQTFYELADESILKLTVGEFFGPSGTVVKNVGVSPNIATTSNPLYQAHFDSIVENLKNYKEIKSLLNVPTTKTFHVNFNKEISESFDSSSIKLVELGGSELDVSLQVSGKQILVTPTSPLLKGKEYILIVEPSIKDLNGRLMNNGSYLKVTVQ